MLNITRERHGDSLILRLTGEILEDVDLHALAGEIAPETTVNCKEISRINSLGVKRWILFFDSHRANGVRLRFTECSPVVVEQINMIRNFVCGGTVESIYVPFSCTNCKKGLVGLFQVENLRQTGLKLPEVKCHRCGGIAVFDDLADEYFRFIER